jgi:hypothetical protein
MKCSQCQFLLSTPINTGDWFEDGCVNEWKCKAKKNKLIGFTETIGIPKLPDWCPIKKLMKKGTPK